MSIPRIYGIGNPLVDVSVSVEDRDLQALGLTKGTMLLIDTEKRRQILDHIEGKSVSYGCAGSAPNTIITIASLGRPTSLGGAVGDDELGRVYRDRLRETGVEDRLAVCPGETGTSIILVTPDGERTMCTFLGVCDRFSSNNVDTERAKDVDWIHFTGYMFDTDSQRAAIAYAVAAAKKGGAKVSFDVADPFAVDRHGDAFREIIGRDVDLLFANQAEAEMLTGKSDPAEAADSLSKSVGVVAVKDGKNGSVVATDGKLHRVAADTASLVDSTGAGDTYAAGFLYSLTEQYDVEAAARFASFLAARIVERRGAQFDATESKRLGEEYFSRARAASGSTAVGG